MKRAYVLLPLAAALAAGCQSPAPCDSSSLNVYWAPGAEAIAGFQVPGLAAAGFPERLGCAAAGVDGIRLRFDGVVAPCSGGVCLGPDIWLCSARGVSIPSGGGTHDVQIDAVDAGGNLKFTSGPVAAAGCGVSSLGVVSQGVAGTLGLDYAFTDTATCQAGSDIVWDLRSGLSTPFDAGSVSCGTTNPFLVSGGLAVPAGVYTFDVIAEAVGVSAQHARCGTTFVHAGAEALAVDLPPPTATCP